MDKDRIFGGSPLAVALRLVVVSIIVGIILSALDIHPTEIVRSLRLLIQRIYDLGFGALEGLFNYFLLGAVIVIPIWLLTRLVSTLRRRNDDRRS